MKTTGKGFFLGLLIMGAAFVLFAADRPPLDSNVPSSLETASFALG